MLNGVRPRRTGRNFMSLSTLLKRNEAFAATDALAIVPATAG